MLKSVFNFFNPSKPHAPESSEHAALSAEVSPLLDMVSDPFSPVIIKLLPVVSPANKLQIRLGPNASRPTKTALPGPQPLPSPSMTAAPFRPHTRLLGKPLHIPRDPPSKPGSTATQARAEATLPGPERCSTRSQITIGGNPLHTYTPTTKTILPALACRTKHTILRLSESGT